MKKYFPIIVILGCALLFVFGIVQLFKLRFDSGDVYAPYSSLRSDPLGTMAFYESIEKLPGVSVRRDFSAANRLPEEKNSAYLHLAASTYEWGYLPQETFNEVENFVRRGGRLVITMRPEFSVEHFHSWDEPATNSQPEKVKNPKNEKKTEPPKQKKKKRLNGDEEPELKTVSIEERWGIGFDIISLKAGEHGVYDPTRVVNQTTLPLPRSLDWHSGIVLTNLGTNWQMIYTRGTNAVVAERNFGRGSVVIATDSYFVSNEAMLKDRHADFLAWLVGPSKTVYFDEAHLGVMENPGIAVLMRKYRLQWLAAGLILLAGLFIWKNSVSLVPAHAEEKQQEHVAGKESAAGFVNLLRRNIPTRDLLDTCFAEWKKSAAQSGKYSAARLQQAEAVFQAEKSLSPKDRNLLQAYRSTSQALKSRNPEPETRKPQA